MTTSPRPIRLYFDFISPYAYLAWRRLPDVAERYGRAIEPVPILFAALLDAHGTKGPAEVPARREYIFRDALRSARAAGFRFEPPPAHPFNPLLALRVASLPMDEPRRMSLISALFAAVWGGGSGVTDPGEVARVAFSVGLDGKRMIALAGEADAKTRVKKATDDAIAFGAFGVPTMDVDGELFFGFDSFAHVESRLSGEAPLDETLIERWRHLPAQSIRKAVR